MAKLNTIQLKSTKQLLGRAGERFLLLGMLSHSKEGKLCIEDSDGSVELDFSKLVSKILPTQLFYRPGNQAHNRMNQGTVCSLKGVLLLSKGSILRRAVSKLLPLDSLLARLEKPPGIDHP
jgi:hypothetical protein